VDNNASSDTNSFKLTSPCAFFYFFFRFLTVFAVFF